MIKLSAYLALAFGLVLGVGELMRNWYYWPWWPFWVVDYIAVALLIFGGQRTLNTGTMRWLTAGWGFTAAMFWMSFFSHVDQLRRGAGQFVGQMDVGNLTTLIGVMLALALAGLLMALLGKRPGTIIGKDAT